MKQKKEAQEFFVGIEEPIDLRKNILEGSRMLIHALQRYERFKQIRHKKLDTINRLNQITREINILLTKLKNELPKVPPKKAKPIKIDAGMPKLIAKKGSKPVKVVMLKPAEKPVEAKPAEPKLTEVERLQQELDSIEGQLKHLS